MSELRTAKIRFDSSVPMPLRRSSKPELAALVVSAGGSLVFGPAAAASSCTSQPEVTVTVHLHRTSVEPVHPICMDGLIEMSVAGGCALAAGVVTG